MLCVLPRLRERVRSLFCQVLSEGKWSGMRFLKSFTSHLSRSAVAFAQRIEILFAVRPCIRGYAACECV